MILLLESSCFILAGGVFEWGCQTNLVNDPEKITTPLYAHKKIQPPALDCVKIFNPPLSSYFIYTQNSIVFHKNSLFITFIKNVCQ